MAAEIPEHVQRFVAEHIDSVSLLDTVLLRAVPERRWNAHEIARALLTGESAAAMHLDRLRLHALVSEDADGYAYAPDPKRAATIDDLAECYARRRHSVIALIYRSSNRSATTLADAFRLRRRDR